MISPKLFRITGGVVALSFFVGGAFCHEDDDEGETDHSYAVHSGLVDVQVTPAAAATPGSAKREFLLSGWYRDKSKNKVAGPENLNWTADVPGGSVNQTGAVSISGFPEAKAQGEVRVAGGSTADTVKVTLWANAAEAAGSGDVIEVPETATGTAESSPVMPVPPRVVLLEQRVSGQCKNAWSSPMAFVGALSVGEQEEVPCSVSIFSPLDAMMFDEGNDSKWLQKGARFLMTPVAPLPVKLTVFLAVTDEAQAAAQLSSGQPPPSPRELAELDVARANLIFETSRAGVRLEPEYKTLPHSADWGIKLGADPYDCVLSPQLPSDPTKADYAYNPYRISVYYVDRINYPLDPVQPRVRGIQCHHWYSGNPAVGDPPGKGPVVFVSYSHHSPVTLAHEVSHALGLNDVEGRLSNRDVMHNLLPDGPLGADARSNLTIGQVFRMNLWNDSWINTRMPKPAQRACDDAAQPCPKEETDPDGQ